ncbi:MAG TPA: hypothetical protein VF763_06195 [Candidatus Limnocylindrales bacterium]
MAPSPGIATALLVVLVLAACTTAPPVGVLPPAAPSGVRPAGCLRLSAPLAFGASWAPDGATIASPLGGEDPAGPSGVVRLIEVATGRERIVEAAVTNQPFAVGRDDVIYYAHRNGAGRAIWRAAPGAPGRPWLADPLAISLAWTEEGLVRERPLGDDYVVERVSPNHVAVPLLTSRYEVRLWSAPGWLVMVAPTGKTATVLEVRHGSETFRREVPSAAANTLQGMTPERDAIVFFDFGSQVGGHLAATEVPLDGSPLRNVVVSLPDSGGPATGLSPAGAFLTSGGPLGWEVVCLVRPAWSGATTAPPSP